MAQEMGADVFQIPPGKTITVAIGEVYINDILLEEDYILEMPNPGYRPFPPQQVPEGCYFVLGDNRNHSSDSQRQASRLSSSLAIFVSCGLNSRWSHVTPLMTSLPTTTA